MCFLCICVYISMRIFSCPLQCQFNSIHFHSCALNAMETIVTKGLFCGVFEAKQNHLRHGVEASSLKDNLIA